MNQPIWNTKSYDPRNHIGNHVFQDLRQKRIQLCRVGTNTTDYVRIVSPLAVDLSLYAMSKLMQERTQ